MKVMGFFGSPKKAEPAKTTEKVEVKKEVKVAAETVLPEKKEKGGFVMKKRYGAFGSKDKADAKCAELKGQGINTEVKEIKIKGNSRWTPEEC